MTQSYQGIAGAGESVVGARLLLEWHLSGANWIRLTGLRNLTKLPTKRRRLAYKQLFIEEVVPLPARAGI